MLVTMSEVKDWGETLLGVPEIWSSTKGDDIKVCILDTGIDFTHPDLKENIADAQDFSGSRSGPSDLNGHGTHCSGIVAAGMNNFGCIGVAPKAKIYMGKVLDDNGSGSIDNIVKGINWALEMDVDIISMSLGSYQDSKDLYKAIKKAYDKGKILIAAAGNDGATNTELMCYPAKYEEVIAVGSINRNFLRSYFSNYSNDLDIVAPGEEVYSTFKGASYAKLSGTSMATPFVSGVCALILAKHKINGGKTPIFNNKDMREHLERYARDLGVKGFDVQYGYGLIDPTIAYNNLAVTPAHIKNYSALNDSDKSREGCVERTYNNERDRGAGHDEALKNAREVCSKSIEEEIFSLSPDSKKMYVMGGDGCVERVYKEERNRSVDHDTALKNAREVCSKAIALASDKGIKFSAKSEVSGCALKVELDGEEILVDNDSVTIEIGPGKHKVSLMAQGPTGSKFKLTILTPNVLKKPLEKTLQRTQLYWETEFTV
ncbi:MAG: S8 family peptidase [Ignavibacteria bacterium]|nr:S8 family peptidase [Ignavibacteria bacterium]